jgi:hypothetical protein
MIPSPRTTAFRVLLPAMTAACLGCVDRPATLPSGAVASDSRGPVVRAFSPWVKPTSNVYTDRFIALWNDIHNPKSGYFNAQGIPYHSVETLLVEAPDLGHETTSEAYSYWLWLEATYGHITKDWSYLADAWANLESYMIPGAVDQPTASAYDPSKPALFAPELDQPSKYPSSTTDIPVGGDPLAAELRGTYGDSNVYAMHWLLDVDNWYGFGRRGDGTGRPVFVDTFQRGPQESVWETIPHPSWDDFKWGGPHGYLDLYVSGSDTPQWKYSVAPDADARAIQAVYWAKMWAEGAGGASVDAVVRKAAKLGDYLRYALFDKYFKPIGCTSPRCQSTTARGAEHYLLSWYFAWGGSAPAAGAPWSWRIGSSASHQGYQNPMAAYALSTIADMRPRSATGWGDWARSLVRQLELYRWLQSREGAIAGGVNNSWGGAYGAPPAGTTTFYGMAYDPSPVFIDPPSNEWFGFQTWSMERVAEYYYVTADPRARAILSRWVGWVLAHTRLKEDGFTVPSTLVWAGQPSASWDEGHQSFDTADDRFNANLHVTVKDDAEDVGTGASLAKTLCFWAARSGDTAARSVAKGILDRIWKKGRDGKGIGSRESRRDYSRFNERLVVPQGWSGKTPHGDPINGSSTFLSIRGKYTSDPDWPRVDAYLRGGEAPTFVYHRFWVEAEIAVANATYGWLFPDPT